jgi:electron transfer flavoprotein beta subunit
LHIYVCVKQTPDSSSVYIDPISEQVDSERFVQILNPADACAVEAAVRLKEQTGGSVTALTLGPDDAEGALRVALAIGVDRAVRLWHPSTNVWDAFTVAAALAAYIQSGQQTGPDLVLCGDASSDWALGIVGPALAQYLDLPQITGVAQLEIVQEQAPLKLRITRRLERGYREVLEAEPPLLLTVAADLNEPRYPSLPAHLAALRASIPVVDALNLANTTSQDEAPETTLLEVHTPKPRPRRIVAPNSRHSAYQRIGEIIAGGATGRKARLVEGSPEELARALVDYLHERGFV